MTERAVCLHGHFYQPPREDPWTGRVERQPSAGEDHDWNARVTRECYAPNAKAGNYERISFDFGPTLLSWLETARPDVYEAILRADRESARRLAGHGNAIAQAYNHVILPLANERDQRTQILWGLADFQFRFGRPAEALWLPETACDDAVLRRLIDHGLRYVILASTQAQRARRWSGFRGDPGPWMDVSGGGLDARRPYRWIDGPPNGKRFIDVFFYDGAVAQEIAFGRLMADAARCARRLESAFEPPGDPARLVSACTDGETYGHHEKFAELGLAHVLTVELPKRALPAVNYGWYLDRHGPGWQVELKAGPQRLGTSWSCAHGVGRWMEDCACGLDSSKHHRWRAPLRSAFDWLRDRLSAIAQRAGEPLLGDVWAVRDAYIDVLLEPRREDDFLRARLRRPSQERMAQARALLEMQKFAMFMYTSCGWFFDDVGGLEAAQNLKYAARAMELARHAGGPNLEPEFLERLAQAPSNDPAYGDAAGVYKSVALARSSASSASG